MKVNLREIEVGDIFSEESHYVVKEVKSNLLTTKFLKPSSSGTSKYRSLAENF